MPDPETTDPAPDGEVLTEFANADSSLRQQEADGEGEAFRRAKLDDDDPQKDVDDWRDEHMTVGEAPGYPPKQEV